MACGQVSFRNGVTDLLRQLEQAQGVGDRGAVLSDRGGKGLVGQAEFADQPVKRLRFLQGVEIGPEKVFDQ